MKLLNRSIRPYLAYSFIIVLVTVILFYFLIQEIVYEEVDESLIAQKEEIIHSLNKLTSAPQQVVPGIQLIPSAEAKHKDSLYNIVLFDNISKEYIPYRVIASGVTIVNKPYTMVLKKSLIDNQDLIESILLVLVVLLVLIVAGFLIINRIISNKIWKPFYNTVNSLHTYEFQSDKKIVFERTDIDEFQALNNSISELIKRNLFVFQSQKEFTENAAHEMQTPLAILQGKIELLMQTDPLDPVQAGLISDLSDAVQRMNRLNKSLLLLTKIENNIFLEKEKVAVHKTIDSIADQFGYLAEQNNITIQLPSTPDFTIEANKSLFEILLSNLIANAIRYTPVNGKVIITTIENDELVFKNTAGTVPLDPSRVFQRFQKSGSDNNSTGLGLAISEKICVLNQFKLQYGYSGGMHEFSIRFRA